MVAYSFKKRFIQPIMVGLSSISLSFDCPPKRQTIRAIGRRRHARPGDELQLYTAMRTKQCRLIGRAICSTVTPVIIWIWGDEGLDIELGKQLLGRKDLETFAQQDGFADSADMAAFWRAEHPGVEKFEGVVIGWRAVP